MKQMHPKWDHLYGKEANTEHNVVLKYLKTLLVMDNFAFCANTSCKH